MRLLRRLLRKACGWVGIKPTPEHAARVAMLIMEGHALRDVKKMCHDEKLWA